MASLRSRVVLVACVATLACAPPGASDTVRAYVHGLAHDPGRTLMLVSPTFLSAPRPALSGVGHRQEEAAGGASTPEALARAQRGWLVSLRRSGYAKMACTLETTVLQEEVAELRAVVRARIRTSRSAPFDVRFLLSRPHALARWKIDAIDSADVPAASRSAACIVAPSRAEGCFE